MDDRNKAAGYLVLRAFFAQFWILQWFGKIHDAESGITAWRNLAIWSAHTTDWMAKTTPLAAWMIRPYTLALPYCELAVGLLLAVGFRSREALFGAAAILVTLDVGLMLQLKHDQVATNTIYLLAVVIALQWEPHRRWTVD